MAKNQAITVEELPVTALVPRPTNPRVHSDAQVAEIVRSIEEFGWTMPILIDDKNGIIAGHGRHMAAVKLGYEAVPCIRRSGLTDAQIRAYVIADNKLTLNASWDDPLLRGELLDLQKLGFDVTLTGFSGIDLSMLLREPETRDPNAAPAVEKDAVSKPGDLWILGTHRVLCGSATALEEVTRLMDGALADIVWTDPPYNVAYEGTAGKIKNDDMDSAAFRQFLTDAFISMHAVMKPGAAIYIAHADTEGLNFRTAFQGAAFKIAGCIIWRKDALVLGRSDYQWQHEPILYGWKPGSRHRWYGGRKQTTILQLGESSPFQQQADGRWSIQIGDEIMLIDGAAEVTGVLPSVIFNQRPKRNADHPTMKPVELIEKMLKNNARPGDLVVDLFGGSGSTLIAADRLGMSARLTELDPLYTDVIVRRWQEYTGRKATLEDGQTFESVEAKLKKGKTKK